MAKRPAKAPEAIPPFARTPLTLDGRVPSASDLASGAQLKLGPSGYLLKDRTVFPTAPERWLSSALLASAVLFSGRVPTEWQTRLTEAMADYFKDRLTELNAVDERDVQEALRAIRATAMKLKTQLNFPRSNSAAYHAAWARIEKVRSPYDERRNLRDELYPAMSLLTSRLYAMDRESRRQGWHPESLGNLIRRLASGLADFGISASGSNGIARKGDADSLSALARLVKSIILGAGLEPPLKMTDDALNKAVLVALKKR